MNFFAGCLGFLIYFSLIFFSNFILFLLIYVTPNSLAFITLILDCFWILFYEILKDLDKLCQQYCQPLPPIKAYSVCWCIFCPNIFIHPGLADSLGTSPEFFCQATLFISWMSKQLFSIKNFWYLILYFGTSQDFFLIFFLCF